MSKAEEKAEAIDAIESCGAPDLVLGAKTQNQTSRFARPIRQLVAQAGDITSGEDFYQALMGVLTGYFPVDWMAMGFFMELPNASATAIAIGPRPINDEWREYMIFSGLEKVNYSMHYGALSPEGTVVMRHDYFDRTNKQHHLADELITNFLGNPAPIGALVVKQPDFQCGISCMRMGPQGFSDPFEHDLFKSLYPPMNIIAHTLHLYRGFEFMRVGIERLIAATPGAVLLFSESGGLLYCTPAALEQVKACFPAGKPWEDLPREFRAWIDGIRAPHAGRLPEIGKWELPLNTPSGPKRFKASVIRDGMGRRFLFISLVDQPPFPDFAKLAAQDLTPKQIEVLTYLPLGYTNAQIAQAMGIAEVTVRKHLQAIGEKLQAEGRTEILFRALQSASA